MLLKCAECWQYVKSCIATNSYTDTLCSMHFQTNFFGCRFFMISVDFCYFCMLMHFAVMMNDHLWDLSMCVSCTFEYNTYYSFHFHISYFRLIWSFFVVTLSVYSYAVFADYIMMHSVWLQSNFFFELILKNGAIIKRTKSSNTHISMIFLNILLTFLLI